MNVAKAIDAPFHGPVCEDGWITPAARDHAGLGTALKPSYEPILVARKPLDGTVAANVLAHGTGAINIDGCRIGRREGDRTEYGRDNTLAHNGSVAMGKFAEVTPYAPHDSGRWPANVVLSHAEDCVLVGERRLRNRSGSVQGDEPSNVTATVYADRERVPFSRHADEDGLEKTELWACVPGCPVRALDEQSGERPSGAWNGKRSAPKTDSVYGEFALQDEKAKPSDTGGASRFFYCAKASRAERSAGLPNGQRSSHPTVKPIDLMRWLVRLVTPPGGVVLDLFAGSGTTGCAAVLEGFGFIGIEREPEYVAIANARIAWWAAHPEGVETAKVYAAERKRAETVAAGQAGLFDEAAA